MVFDLDDTLIRSSLNLDLIRSELKIADKTPILEYIETLPPLEREVADKLVVDHEIAACEDAVLNPGVLEILSFLNTRNFRTGLFTRNCRPVADKVITKFDLEFDRVITRDCAPPKPSPVGLIAMIESWGIQSEEVIYVGDYLYDIEVGIAAGVKTALYVPGESPDYMNKADLNFKDFFEFKELIVSKYSISVCQ